MTTEIRLVQFIEIRTVRLKRRSRGDSAYRFQNYYVGESKSFGGNTYRFAPFQVEGATASLDGENEQLRILFPATDYAIALVELGQGNRRSRLTLHTRFISTANGEPSDNGPRGIYVGLGASFSAETVELRFSSALDAAGSQFPATTLTSENVGVLPLESQLQLR